MDKYKVVKFLIEEHGKVNQLMITTFMLSGVIVELTFTLFTPSLPISFPIPIINSERKSVLIFMKVTFGLFAKLEGIVKLLY